MYRNAAAADLGLQSFVSLNPLLDYETEISRLRAKLEFWRVLAIGLAVACALLVALTK